MLCQLLDAIGIIHYMVEIGGEVSVKGNNDKGELWKIGIDKPVSSLNLEDRQNQATIALNNQSIASSGNYRNFIK